VLFESFTQMPVKIAKVMDVIKRVADLLLLQRSAAPRSTGISLRKFDPTNLFDQLRVTDLLAITAQCRCDLGIEQNIRQHVKGVLQNFEILTSGMENLERRARGEQDVDASQRDIP